MSAHIFSYRTLLKVLGLLLVLTLVTVGASYVDLGWANVWVALLIASCKASLVLIIFMHMKYEGRLLAISFLSTILFLAIMIGFTFWDISFR
ncbi:MAG: cytochrome C oxidase subunit IV family protein [Desulfobacterales bacterium]|nr:cytochrome C oxidase subunit IV family protein [Desulfobacterales bacterium]